MKFNSIKRIFIFIFLISVLGTSQAQSDSITLTHQEYVKHILLFHPIAKKADLQLKAGEAEWLLAKGNLDPIINSSWSQKNFDKKLYYRQYQGKIKVPTQYGVDVVGGYENTEGTYLNPENKTDKLGLWHLGLEANVIQGLLVNERRMAFQKAKIFQEMTENQRKIILNELLYNASKAYLKWQQYYYNQTVLKENINIAQVYLNNTKIAYSNGEKTRMDTLEAFILYQDANTIFQKNEMTLAKYRQNIENYLWYDNIPVDLQEMTQPENYTNKIYASEPNQNPTDRVNNHPLILSYINKKSYYEIEQKLKKEKLKPKLKLKYNPLLGTSDNSIAPRFSLTDFKWGFDFSMPLLLRSERANIQKGEIKIQETALDIQNKINELNNKVEASLQQQLILEQQIALSEQNLEGYQLLLEGENEKFQYGESSVFLLNKRQEKYINGRLKLIELTIKLQQERLNYYYYANRLIND